MIFTPLVILKTQFDGNKCSHQEHADAFKKGYLISPAKVFPISTD